MVLVIFRPPSRVRPVLPLGAAVFSDRSRQSHAGLPSKSSSRFPGFGFRSGKLVLRSSSADAKPPPGKSFGRGLAVTLLVLAIVGALTKFLDLSPNFALIAFGLQWGFFLLQGWPQRSEVLYDASGSLTHLSIVLAALLSDPVRTPRQTILSIFAVVWCTRLGTFLFNRISQDSKDSRFTDLKTEFWSFSIAWNLQVLWVFLLQLPVMMVNTTLNQPSIGAWDVLGWALWCMGFLVEAVADGQKFAFRGNLANRGRFITSGLWRYSRHPNYFGEILMWIGLCTSFTSCITGIPQLLAWISPAFNAILLVYVSGVPLLEKAGEKKWGQEPEYRHYMENTSCIVPWFPAPEYERDQSDRGEA